MLNLSNSWPLFIIGQMQWTSFDHLISVHKVNKGMIFVTYVSLLLVCQKKKVVSFGFLNINQIWNNCVSAKWFQFILYIILCRSCFHYVVFPSLDLCFIMLMIIVVQNMPLLAKQMTGTVLLHISSFICLYSFSNDRIFCVLSIPFSHYD